MLVWQQVVSVTACLVVALAVGYQHHVRRGVLGQLAAVTPQYEQARQRTDQLNRLQAELKEAQAEADLITYLKHPWKRTQIVAELLKPLPDEITFTVLQIGSQHTTGNMPAGQPLLTEKRQDEAAKPAQSPAVEDLKRLREEMDPVQTVVTIEGLTTDIGVLHRYLGHLNGSSLFRKVDLETLDGEQASGDKDKEKGLHFVATLQVERPYGVPGGPSGPPAASVASLGRIPQPASLAPATTPRAPHEERPQ